MWVPSLDWEDALEEKMATYSSILAWRIPGTEERGRLQSMGSQSYSPWGRKESDMTERLNGTELKEINGLPGWR